MLLDLQHLPLFLFANGYSPPLVFPIPLVVFLGSGHTGTVTIVVVNLARLRPLGIIATNTILVFGRIGHQMTDVESETICLRTLIYTFHVFSPLFYNQFLPVYDIDAGGKTGGVCRSTANHLTIYIIHIFSSQRCFPEAGAVGRNVVDTGRSLIEFV